MNALFLFSIKVVFSLFFMIPSVRYIAIKRTNPFKAKLKAFLKVII